MKLLSLSISCFLFLLLSPLSSVATDTFVVSGNPKAPPVVWEEYDRLTGIGPDLVQSIFSELGINFMMSVEGNWQQVQDKCKSGKVDMLVSAYKNDERASYMEYSLPYLPQPTVIIVEKGKEFLFGRWESLIGKKGVTQFGESYGQKFDEFMAAKLDVQRTTMKKSFDMLLNEEADYLLIDFFKGVNYSRMMRKTGQIRFLPRPVVVEKLHLAIAKSSPLAKYLPRINARLEALKKDGTVTRLIVDTNNEFEQSLLARERMFRRARRDVAAAEGVDPLDKPDFHQRYKEAIANAIFLAP